MPTFAGDSPEVPTGYSGTILARRDAVLDDQLSATRPRSLDTPVLPAFLAAPAGKIGPADDRAGPAPQSDPTPQGELPPLKGLATKPSGTDTPADAESDGHEDPAPAREMPAGVETDGAAEAGDAGGSADPAAEDVLLEREHGVFAPSTPGGGAAGSRRSQSSDGDGDGDEALLMPLPEPEHGTATLPRQGLAVDTSAPPFDAPQTLAARTSKAAEQLEAEIADYRGIYARAAQAARSLYAQIVSRLVRTGREARDEGDRLSARRQRDLDRGLATLDDGLAAARARLRTTRDNELAQLDAAARDARRRIRRAASGGLDRLRARARRIETDLQGKRGEAAAIVAMPAEKIASLTSAHGRTLASLQNLRSNAATLLPQPDNEDGRAMKAAEFEALLRDIAFPIEEANLELDETVGHMTQGIARQVEPTNRSICMSFCPFEKMKATLAGEAELAVGRAKRKSIRELRKMHRQLRRQLEKTFHEGERNLINQHRAQRLRLVQSATDRQRHEHPQHQQQANTASVMLGATAGAQGAALSSIHDRIAAQAVRGEAALAKAATEYSHGLISNGVPRGHMQLKAIEGRIAGAAERLAAIAQQASGRFAEGAKGAASFLQGEAGRTEESGGAQVREAEPALAALAGPITETVDGFVRSVDQNFATAMTGLEGSLARIRQGLVDNFAGDPPPRQDDDKKAPPPGDECTSCPPAPAAEPQQQSGKGGEAPESVNAFIDRLTGYIPAPHTERNVASYREQVPRLIKNDLERRSRALGRILGYTDSAPYSVLDQLRGVTGLQGSAIEEHYNSGGKNLREDLDWFLNAGNPCSGVTTRVEAIRAARAYLNGDVASGARHELNVCVNWSNDSAQIDRVMKSLTPEQMGEMFERFPDELREVREDLNELDGRVFDALKAGDVGEAIALRGQAAIDTGREARGYTGTDRAGDAINAMYREAQTGNRLAGGPALREIEGARTRARRVAAEWADIQSDFARIVGPEFNRPVGGGEGPPQPGDAIINYAARGISYEVQVPNEMGEGTHTETRFDDVNEAQRRLITALVRHHEGSPEARAARLALELTRPGGANPERVHEATYDEALNPRLIVEGAPGGIEAARRRHAEALERQQRTYALLDEYALSDGVCRDRPTADIRAEVADLLAATFPANSDRADYVRSLVLADPHDEPAFVNQTVRQLEYAMEGSGTNVDAMRRALASLTREQYQLVKEQWALDHNGEDLDVRIGIPGHGTWFERLVTSETSGDTALEMERLRFGIATTEQQQAELAALEMHQQIREASWLGKIVAGSEFDQLEADYRHLLSGMGASGMRIGPDGEMQFLDAEGVPTPLGHFDAAGRFQAQPGFTAEDLALAMTVGRESAAAYRAATDRIADMIATALVVTAAIVTTALTGGAAASIWIPVLVTAAAGVAAMGVKWAIKGGRYGSEEMLFDLASTIIQAATAGIGAAAGVALRGGGKAVGALAKSWRMSEQALATAAAGGATASKALPALTFGQELFVGALTAGFAGGANAAIAPDSWRSDDYARDILVGIVRGAVGGAIGAGTARSVGKLTGPLGEIPSRGLASGASGAASRIAELTFDDAVLGRRVTWSEMMDQASTAFLQNLVQGLGEGAADVSMRNRYASRRAEHDWHQQHSPEAIHQREAALRRMAEAELARRGTPANDNPPPAGTIPEAEGAPPRPRGETGEVDGGASVASRGRDGDAAAPRQARGSIPDEGALSPSALRPEGEEPVARLRSALGDDDGPATLRTGRGSDDEVTKPGVPVPSPEFPNGVNLRPGDLDHWPEMAADTVVRGTDPTDGDQARRNYDIMRARTPDREVLLAFNPTTGEYMAVQGLPRSVTPPPEGWITLRHSHPRVIGGDEYSHFASILPSGIGGDFSVLRTEVDRLQAQYPNAVVRRASTIDIEVNGQHVQTVFEITKRGDNYSLSVTLHPPQHGVESLGPFTGDRDGALREYAYRARDLTAGGSDFGLGHNKSSGPDLLTETGRPDAPSRVVRGATLSERERADAMFVAGRMAQTEAFERQARGAAPRGEFDPVIARAATSADAQERVRAMGLVGQPDSLARLTRLLNSSDPAFTPEMRSALARATLEATRTELIRTGNLAPGDELLMLFRGVTGARTDDYEQGGMDISRLGPGGDEDAGRGLYGSQDFQSALNYAGSDSRGVVLPLIVRRSELGNVIDVRSGTPLGDRWLAYVRATARGGVVKETHPHLSRVLYPFTDSPIGIYRDGRGDRFEAFLKALADDPTLPPAIREAARDPHITLMDLGGVASWGNDRSMLTDQFAMHHQRILDLFNDAHGFPRPARLSVAEAEPARLRSALGDDETPDAAPLPAREDGETTESSRPVAAAESAEDRAPAIAADPETQLPSPRTAPEPASGESAAVARGTASSVEGAAPQTPVAARPPRIPATEIEALQRLGVDFSKEKSRAAIGRRIAAVVDLLPEDHPMQASLRDIANQLKSRTRRFPEGRDPWLRLANLVLDEDFGSMIAEQLNRPLPRTPEEARLRRASLRREMSVKRSRAEETARGNDLRRLHAEELVEAAPDRAPPPANRRLREVEATPEYSLLATDMPILARGANGAIDPAEGARIAATMRDLHGFDEGRNVAVAELRSGDASQLLIAKSNNQALPGMTTLPRRRLFTTFDVNARPGDNHTESILLEHAARVIDAGRFADDPDFAVSMYTERAPCESCQGVIRQFAQRYPEVAARSMVSWSGPPAGQASFADVAAGLAP